MPKQRLTAHYSVMYFPISAELESCPGMDERESWPNAEREMIDELHDVSRYDINNSICTHLAPDILLSAVGPPDRSSVPQPTT